MPDLAHWGPGGSATACGSQLRVASGSLRQSRGESALDGLESLLGGPGDEALERSGGRRMSLCAALPVRHVYRDAHRARV